MFQDIDLWRDLQRGDHQALERIYQREIKYLYNYGKKLTSDIHLVEDSIHDLFVYLWNKRETLSDTDNIRAYITISLRRRIIDSIKKNKTTTDADELIKKRDDSPNFQEFLIFNEIESSKKNKLDKVLTSLSTRQREILYLKFYMEMDYDAICKAMDISYQSARNLTNSALNKVRKLWMLGFLLFFI